MTKKEGTQHGPLLPATSFCLPVPPTGLALLSLSQMLQKSGTVNKVISDVYAGDVQYKAQTWYLLLTDK